MLWPPPNYIIRPPEVGRRRAALTFTGSGTVVVVATAAGNGTYAPFYATDTITVTAPPATDTPTLPPWGLAFLALLLMGFAAQALPRRFTRTVE